MDDDAEYHDESLCLSVVVDLADRGDLFDILDNEQVVALSRLSDDVPFADAEYVLKSTGIRTRRLLRSGARTIDLAVEVLDRLIAAAGLDIFASSTILFCHSHVRSDECRSVSVALKQHLLTNRIAANVVEFNLGCSGFLRLLQEATLYLEADPLLRRVIVLNVETPETWHDGADRLFNGILSAGATASLIERGRGHAICSVHADDFPVPATLRLNPRPLFHRELSYARTFRGQLEQRMVMRMNAEPVFLAGIELMLENLRAAMAQIDPEPGKRILVIPHQPSGKLLRALIAAARIEFPNCQLVNNLADFGNTISATIPTILVRLPEVIAANGFAPLQPGEPLILLAAGICMERMADEMSAGFACLSWCSSNDESRTSRSRDSQVVKH